MKIAAALLLLPLMLTAANYTAHKTVIDGIEVVQLADAAHHLEASIVPSIGNMAYELKAGGTNVLHFPFKSPAELKARPTLCGIPFLGPWANRLDEDAFWANGKKYVLNPGLGNIGKDGRQHPIHGLLNYSTAWVLTAVKADSKSAWATSKLEFWKYPSLMAQFPFAHTITMTYRLSNGALEVETSIENQSADPMPVAIGFHPYFRISDAPRDDWKVHLAARDHLVLNAALIPTGEKKAVEYGDPQQLKGIQLDDGFSNLVRGGDGRAEFWVEGKAQRVAVAYGPKFPVAVVYAPSRGQFICFEPMAGPTNAFNMSHAGLYPDLQNIPAGGQWKESFWIRPSGF